MPPMQCVLPWMYYVWKVPERRPTLGLLTWPDIVHDLMRTMVDRISTAVNLDEGLESPSLRGWRGANSGRSMHYLTNIQSGGACQQRFANGSGPQPPITTITDNHLRLRTRQGVVVALSYGGGRRHGPYRIGYWWLSLSGSVWLLLPLSSSCIVRARSALGDFAPSDAAISNGGVAIRVNFTCTHCPQLATLRTSQFLLPQPPDSIA